MARNSSFTLHLFTWLFLSSAASASAFIPIFHERSCIASRLQEPRRRRAAAAVADGGGIPADAVTASLEAPLLRGLERMSKLMTADFFLSQPSLKQLYGKSVKSVAVKDSSIEGAGKGLFATKNIQRGSIVSFYPAHALGVELGENQLWVSSNDEEYFSKNPPGSSSYLHATDQPIFNRPSLLADISPELKDVPIYLDANPNRAVDQLWVSHYINDGAIVTSNDEMGVSHYYEQSKRKKNCIHIPFGPSPIMATVATRKIKKGEELFTSYGCVYWLGVQFPDDESNGPDLNGQIQQQIKESALDLFEAMKGVSTTYGNQIEELKSAYGEL